MPRAKTRVNYSNFIKGKSSDFNPLYPPENTARILDNVDVTINGKVGRRLGIEPETDFNLPIDPTIGPSWLSGLSLDEIKSYGIGVFEWSNVDGITGVSYVVIRLGNNLLVYNAGGFPLSDSLVKAVYIGGQSTSSLLTSANGTLSATSGKGVLICTGSDYNPFFVEHNTATDAWTTTRIYIRIRDLDGVPDESGLEENPDTLTGNHKYNLYNQGWKSKTQSPKDVVSSAVWNAWKGLPVPSQQNINTYFEEYLRYPSLSEISHFGDSTDTDGEYEWKPSLVRFNSTGNSRAPMGHFIIDAFNGYSREFVADIAGLEGLKNNLSRPEAVAFFAGRVWYGAVDGVVYYSQIVEGTDQLGECFQSQDPTAADINELLDTDGGTIKILDLGACKSLAVVGDGLLVMGTSGVWVIAGGDTGFTANSHLVAKLTTSGVTGGSSVVSSGEAVFYWGDEGVFAVGKDYSVRSLSINRINQAYGNIPSAARDYAQGVYDEIEGRVYWFYSYYTNDTDDFKHKYTNALVYSTSLDAFWDYSFSNDGYVDDSSSYPVILGGLIIPDRQVGFVEELLTDSEVTVTDDAEDVTVSVLTTSFNPTTLKLVMLLPDSIGSLRTTFGQFSSRSFKDWSGLTSDDLEANANYTGSFPVAPVTAGNYTSVVEALPTTLGESSLQKQATYLYTYYDYVRGGYGSPTVPEEFDGS